MRKVLIIFLALIFIKVTDVAATEQAADDPTALAGIQTHEQRLQQSASGY